jgi:hypothetical protein
LQSKGLIAAKLPNVVSTAHPDRELASKYAA